MAQRGTPLPFRVRQEIKERCQQGQTRRAVAEQLSIARATVDKYASKFRPKALERNAG